MFRSLSVILVSGLVLTSCGTVRESRLNPFNWFGQGRSEAVNTSVATGPANPLLPKRRAISFFDKQEADYAGRPVETVTQLLIERRPGGAILRVTGVADRLGPFDVKLVEDEANPDAATLSYTLSALQQPGPRSTGEWARTVTAAVWLTDQDLAGISAIRVAGRTNVQVSRR
ncbi:hypothetical protein [Salipiger sp.]|uniref:hypothetical protein n=1 Tax=Salipiger sp. TaxID=2078585 RepID=UPI003A973737